jgi:hypothetical protein
MWAMTPSPPPDRASDEFWRDYLTNGSPSERRQRRILKGRQGLTEVVALHVPVAA